MQIVIVEIEEFKGILREIILEALNNGTENEKYYSINGAAKKLHLAHATVNKIVERGLLRTDAAGRLSETEINNFLKNPYDEKT